MKHHSALTKRLPGDIVKARHGEAPGCSLYWSSCNRNPLLNRRGYTSLGSTRQNMERSISMEMVDLLTYVLHL